MTGELSTFLQSVAVIYLFITNATLFWAHTVKNYTFGFHPGLSKTFEVGVMGEKTLKISALHLLHSY